MTWILVIGVCLALLVLFTGAFLWLSKNQRGDLQGGFRLLSDSFESLQRNLVVAQKEFERSHDQKTTTLRQELGQELQANRRELQAGLAQGTTSLEQRFSSIDTRLDVRLKELSQGVQTRLEENVKEQFKHFEKVQIHLKNAEQQLIHLNTVGESINDLNNLLKLPHLRGGFGEATLERILSDLLPTDAYELQYKISPTSAERVDAVIKYPQYVLPIDSKFPREQVLPLFETNDPQQLEIARKNLVEVMKTLGRQIKEKYIRPDCGTTEMAMLFVPSETLYFEVIRNPRLCEELAKFRVFAVSPNTLAVTLHAVSMARGYYEMAKGVESTITEIKRAQQHFGHFEKKFDEVGSSLSRAQNAFNTAQTHLSRYESAVTRLSGAEPVIAPSKMESVTSLPSQLSLEGPETTS